MLKHHFEKVRSVLTSILTAKPCEIKALRGVVRR